MRLSRALSAGLILSCTVTWAACSGVSIKTDFDPNVDFSRLHQFAWFSKIEVDKKPNPDPLYNNSLLDQRVRGAVENGLNERGFKKVSKELKPDFYVSYRIRTQEKLNLNSSALGFGYGYGPFMGYAGPSWSGYEYTEGTLIVDFVDPEKNLLLWRGYASGAFDSPEVTEEKLTNVVRKILEKYPPEKKK